MTVGLPVGVSIDQIEGALAESSTFVNEGLTEEVLTVDANGVLRKGTVRQVWSEMLVGGRIYLRIGVPTGLNALYGFPSQNWSSQYNAGPVRQMPGVTAIRDAYLKRVHMQLRRTNSTATTATIQLWKLKKLNTSAEGSNFFISTLLQEQELNTANANNRVITFEDPVGFVLDQDDTVSFITRRNDTTGVNEEFVGLQSTSFEFESR